MADEENQNESKNIIYVMAKPNTVSSPIFRPEEYLPVFAEEVEEDPEDFIVDVEKCFEDQQWNIGEREKCILIHRQLRGAASKANSYYMNKDKNPTELYSRLISTFGTQANFNELRTKLDNTYFNGPIEGGRLEIFIDRFSRLHKRLYTGATNNRVMDELIQGFPSNKRNSLIAADIDNIEKFIKISKKLMKQKLQLRQ